VLVRLSIHADVIASRCDYCIVNIIDSGDKLSVQCWVRRPRCSVQSHCVCAITARVRTTAVESSMDLYHDTAEDVGCDLLEWQPVQRKQQKITKRLR